MGKLDTFHRTDIKDVEANKLGQIKYRGELSTYHLSSVGALRFWHTEHDRGYAVASVVYDTFKGDRKGRYIKYRDGNKKNVRLDNLFITKGKSETVENIKYVPTLEYQNDTGGTVNVPPYIKLANYKVNVDKLRNPAFQKQEADRLFKWLQNHCPHGIFQEFMKLMIDYDAKLEAIQFGMSKFDTPNLKLIKKG